MKCTECKFFTGNAIMANGKHYLVCQGPAGEYEFVPEFIALDDDLGCDMFEYDNSNDDTTKKP